VVNAGELSDYTSKAPGEGGNSNADAPALLRLRHKHMLCDVIYICFITHTIRRHGHLFLQLLEGWTFRVLRSACDAVGSVAQLPGYHDFVLCLCSKAGGLEWS
jgi:hypothetical protein